MMQKAPPAYPFETLPDGTVRRANSANNPRQKPTCDDWGRPLPDAEPGYMANYPPTPCTEIEYNPWSGLAEALGSMDALAQLERMGYL